MMDISLIKDGPDGVDVDCYYCNAFVGCARLQLDTDPMIIDCSPILKEFVADEPARLEYLIDRVQVLRAQ
jgi:hypothetical protein